MWQNIYRSRNRCTTFFSIMAQENGLYINFKTNADLMFNAGFNLTELNQMMPFERATYLQLWNEFAEEKEKAQQQDSNGAF